MAGHSCGKALLTSFMRMRWFVVATWWPRSPKPWCCGMYAEPFQVLGVAQGEELFHHLAPHLRPTVRAHD
eukprot:15431921-Alexandrium_andersonii.AAC.1